jgi:hypothetical protein
MNVNILYHEDHSEVRVEDAGVPPIVFTFGDAREAKAFWQGFKCCQSVINSLVQGLPRDYKSERITP